MGFEKISVIIWPITPNRFAKTSYDLDRHSHIILFKRMTKFLWEKSTNFGEKYWVI